MAEGWPQKRLRGARCLAGWVDAWLTRPRSQRSREDEALGAKVRASFLASGRTYGARRAWRDLLAEGLSCGLHRIERLMRLQALKARPDGVACRLIWVSGTPPPVASNVLDRSFEAPAPNRKWIADFTYVWTAEGWLYVAAVVDLFSRRVVGWSMSAAMCQWAAKSPHFWACKIPHFGGVGDQPLSDRRLHFWAAGRGVWAAGYGRWLDQGLGADVLGHEVGVLRRR